MPSFLTPQVWVSPALTDANAPSGGVAWPSSSLPQQARVSSSLNPQVWNHPALTETKAAPGGAAWL